MAKYTEIVNNNAIYFAVDGDDKILVYKKEMLPGENVHVAVVNDIVLKQLVEDSDKEFNIVDMFTDHDHDIDEMCTGTFNALYTQYDSIAENRYNITYKTMKFSELETFASKLEIILSLFNDVVDNDKPDNYNALLNLMKECTISGELPKDETKLKADMSSFINTLIQYNETKTGFLRNILAAKVNNPAQANWPIIATVDQFVLDCDKFKTMPAPPSVSDIDLMVEATESFSSSLLSRIGQETWTYSNYTTLAGIINVYKTTMSGYTKITHVSPSPSISTVITAANVLLATASAQTTTDNDLRTMRNMCTAFIKNNEKSDEDDIEDFTDLFNTFRTTINSVTPTNHMIGFDDFKQVINTWYANFISPTFKASGIDILSLKGIAERFVGTNKNSADLPKTGYLPIVDGSIAFMFPYFNFDSQSSPSSVIGLKLNVAFVLKPTDRLTLVENYFKEAGITTQAIEHGADPYLPKEPGLEADLTALFLTTSQRQALLLTNPEGNGQGEPIVVSDTNRKAFSLYESGTVFNDQDKTIECKQLFGNTEVLLPVSIICKK